MAKVMKRKDVSPLVDALLETAQDMHGSGLLDHATHAKITRRHAGTLGEANSEPISGQEIRLLREQAKLSQPVFADLFNLSKGHLSKLERGEAKADGPALALFNIARRKGVSVLL